MHPRLCIDEGGYMVEQFQCDVCYTLHNKEELARICENSHDKVKVEFPPYVELVIAGKTVRYYPTTT